MKYLKTPFQLGDVILPSNIFYAPLAGCSDYPFRQMSAKFKPGLMFCEMVKMDAIIRKNERSLQMLDYDETMRPIGGQLVGSNPKIAAQAAKMIEELGFDTLDLNCGCPVDKVTKDGSGSGMLKNPELIGEILSNMIAAVKIPVTVKIRTGWDEDSIIAPEVTKIAEKAGAKAITIHGRTRKQGYTGAANWDHIKSCKDVAETIKVIGNGDIFDADAAKRIFEHTGCDGILVSRGTMGRPWIVEDILRHLQGLEPEEWSLEERREALLEHFHHAVDYRSELGALIDMRRVGCWYFTKARNTREFRGSISSAKSISEVKDLITNFDFEEIH
jgi:nifR3 family TIM-barrel protein